MKKKMLIITTVSDSLPFFKGQITILKNSFDIELVSSSGRQLEEMCTIHAVKGHSIRMKREISIVSDFISLFNLMVLFWKTKPYIVHGNTPKASLLSMIAARIVSVPVRIYYVHGLRYQGESNFKRKILMLMEKITCWMSTDVIAVSRGIKSTLKLDKITGKNISMIWNGSVNGVDLEYFNPDGNNEISSVNNIYNIDKDDFVFGFIGRLVSDKGINELVNSFDKINKIYKNSKLILVGKFEENLDPLQNNTLVLIENNSNIINVGFQKDIRPFLKTMNVFVFPSYREGFGIALMEAGAMGVPSIASDITGCNEIVSHNKSGFLVRVKDESLLYEKMEYCLMNRDMVQEMANSSRFFFQENFEQKYLWSRALKHYESISE